MTDSQDEVTQFIATKLALTDTASGAGDALELETTLAQSLTVLYADRVVPGAYNRSIGVGADSLVITEYAPTINQLGTAVSPANDTLIITEYAPSAYVDQIARPGADSLVITEYAPSVATDQIVAVANDTLAITEYAPTVSSNADNTIAVANDTLVITEQAPSVVVDQVIAVGQDTLTITEYAPTVNVQADTTISVANDTLVITEYAPTVTGGDAYIVNSLAPPVVADFAGVLNSGTEYYRVGGSDSTFDSMFTYTGASLKTMTDSDGNLKWAPHNYVVYSEDVSQANWSVSNATKTGGQSDLDGGTSAFLLTEDSADNYHSIVDTTRPSIQSGATYTQAAWVKDNGRRYVNFTWYAGTSGDWAMVTFDLTAVSVTESYSNDNTNGFFATPSGAITSAGGGWYLCEASFRPRTGSINFAYCLSNGGTPFASGDYAASIGRPEYLGGGTAGAYFSFPHVYRSDLGGMVDNPNRADSYVPTTTAAVYQARRNHHRFNGSTYDNKGILLESEARTNLIATSTPTSGMTAQAVTIAYSQSGSPDGGSNAINVAATAGGTDHYASRAAVFAVTAAVNTYSISVYIKDVSAGYAYFEVLGTTPGVLGEYVINLTTGAIAQTLTAASGGITVENVGNSWWRATITDESNGSSGNPTINVGPHDGSASASWTPSVGETIQVYGYQCEIGSTPSSYIPTSGATATRAAETLTIAGANMSASTTAMSFHHQGEINYADEGSVAQQTFWRWQTDASNYLSVDLDTDSTDTGEVNANQADGGTVDTVTSDSYSPGINVAFNIATRNTNGAINLAVGGTAVTEDSTPASLNDASSDTFELGYDMMGTHALFRQWADDIGDTGIESATS